SDHERYPADVKCLGFLYLYVGRYPRNNASRNIWKEKFEANKERDRRKFLELDAMGWKYFVIWQCEIRDEEGSRRRLSEFLGPARIRTPSNQ
ncbi:MAG: hypothetical protein BECKG1743D_GA0114223_103115, partial [Candidatus Kentron sp. G]